MKSVTAAIPEKLDASSISMPILIGCLSTLTIAIGLISWSSLAPLASAVMAFGTVVVEGNVKTVQSLDGGVIEAVMVHDGDVVSAGQPLAQFESKAQRNQIKTLRFLLTLNSDEQARLHAEISGQVHPMFKSLDPDAPSEVLAIEPEQKTEFDTRMETQRLRLEENASERSSYAATLKGVEDQLTQIKRRLRLADDDTAAAAFLANSGAGTLKARREMESTAASLTADQMSLDSRRAELVQDIRRSELISRRISSAFVETDLTDLKKLSIEEQDLRQRLDQATVALDRTLVRSPVAGYVMNQTIHVIGAVVTAGAPILDVVPSFDKLIVEAQVRPIDADYVTAGSKVIVRGEGPAAQVAQSYTGHVKTISADRIFDHSKSDSYFLVRIEMDGLKQAYPWNVHFRPGIPLEVMVLKPSQTLVAYLTRPLFEAFVHSMRD